MSLAAGGVFLAALVVTLAVADDETTREARLAQHSAPPPVRVAVHPRVGRPWTLFRLELVSSQRTGRQGQRERDYQAAVRGPLRWACVIENEAPFSRGPPGSHLHAVLDPIHANGSHWCRGSFSGVVRYRDAICGSERCHDVHIQRAGSFSFTVR